MKERAYIHTMSYKKKPNKKIFKIIDVFVKVTLTVCAYVWCWCGWWCVCIAKQGFYLSNTEEELWCPAPRWAAEC
jgi:hypothetical protein